MRLLTALVILVLSHGSLFASDAKATFRIGIRDHLLQATEKNIVVAGFQRHLRQASDVSIVDREDANIQVEPLLLRVESAKIWVLSFVVTVHDPVTGVDLSFFHGIVTGPEVSGCVERAAADVEVDVLEEFRRRGVSPEYAITARLRRSTEAKAAQPGATDNPDDAQRLREDH